MWVGSFLHNYGQSYAIVDKWQIDITDVKKERKVYKDRDNNVCSKLFIIPPLSRGEALTINSLSASLFVNYTMKHCSFYLRSTGYTFP